MRTLNQALSSSTETKSASSRHLTERLLDLANEAASLGMPRTMVALRTALMTCGYEAKTVDLALGEIRENSMVH